MRNLHPDSSPKNSGFALVVVLCVVALLVVLIVGFMVRATTERRAASSSEASAAARQFATTVTGLVQGQINLATSQGTSIGWASQPGLIRTFANTGTMQQAFKLYSAPEMILSSGSALNPSDLQTALASDMPPANWSSSKALWTDLNAPVENNGLKSFPIVEQLGPNMPPEGLTIGAAPGATAYQPVPLPVRWLYVLQDGTLVSPTAGGSASTVTVPGETKDNPITGRIAFWTDDECCKVNINTASEGTFFDTPRGMSQQEMTLARYQPAQREYQRYPGHPAMTSLSTVFPQLSADQIYEMVPRVVGGGSKGGTVWAAAISPENPPDRLYASVDELIFNPNRAPNPGGSPLTRSQISDANFLLTARSRAPEVNLFNLPRVACWPVYQLNGANFDPDRTTVFDRMIATCSTINGKPYYFQRQDAASATNDISIPRNQNLISYLQYLTSQPVPGFGGTFLGKYPDDRDQILTEIFDYVRATNLYDGNLAAGCQYTPGFYNTGGVTSGLVGHGWVTPSRTTTTYGFGRAYTLSELGIGFICNAVADDPATSTVDESNGSNTVASNKVLNGTPLAAGEKYIQAIIVYEFFSPSQGWTGMRADMQVEIEGLDKLSVTVGGSTINLGLPSTGVVPYGQSNGNVDDVYTMSGGRAWGGNPSWRACLYNKSSRTIPGYPASMADDSSSGKYPSYPFIGIPVKIKAPPTGGTMTFNGPNTITVRTYAGATKTPSPATLMQTFRITLPGGTFPVPNLVDKGTDPVPSFDSAGSVKESWWNFQLSSSRPWVVGVPSGQAGRLFNLRWSHYNGNNGKLGRGAFFRSDGNYDVVRSVFPKHGDYRLIAGSGDIPDGVFALHADWSNTSKFMATTLGASSGPTTEQTYDTRGKYFSGINYSADPNSAPDLAVDATATPESTGDVDAGLPRAMDGPYINKCDEGNIAGNGSAIPYFDNSSRELSPGATFFSANRMMPSPGTFGSLPTGVKSGKPWQTLLFRPQSSHPQSPASRPGFPADHLLMDLFWMPVVQPYAISDGLSTAGKINMNFQIVPFGVGPQAYLTRNTAIRALLKGEKVSAISNADYVGFRYSDWSSSDVCRLPINADETLSQFQGKFANGEIFKSATEICDLHIVPADSGATAAKMAQYWSNHIATGENMRERIYTTLYPRLTTKSNTYTVHFRTQSLKKSPASAPGTWTEGRDVVKGEYRGSTTIERFIDASNPNIPDYASNPASIPQQKTLDAFYKWRVLSNRQFSP